MRHAVGTGKTDAPREANRFRELTLFYAVAWANWGLTALFLALLLGNTFAEKTADGPHKAIIRGFQLDVVGTAVATFALVLISAFLHRRAARRRDAASNASAAALTSERLQRKLANWERFVSKEAGGPPTKVFVRPSDASVMWTESSGTLNAGEARIVLTTSFWTSVATEDELIRAAMAHEAGHVSARDVELFHWLLSCEWALALVGGIGLTIRLILFPILADTRPIPSLIYFIGQFGLAATAVLAGWSALLKARELQADAFACDVLGDPTAMVSSLQRQLDARRSERLGLRDRVWRRIVEPPLAWRISLPALRGDIGSGVAIQLGLTVIATTVIGWWAAQFLGRYEALEGLDLVLFAPVAIGVVCATYVFGWWRARSSIASTTPIRDALSASAAFLGPSIVVMPIALVLLQVITGGSLAAAGTGIGGQLAATFIAIVIVCGALGSVIAVGVVGNAIDTLRAKPTPSLATSLVSGTVCFVSALVASMIAAFASHIAGDENELRRTALYAISAASSAPLLATVSHVLTLRSKRQP